MVISGLPHTVPQAAAGQGAITQYKTERNFLQKGPLRLALVQLTRLVLLRWFGVSPNLNLLFPFGALKESDAKSP